MDVSGVVPQPALGFVALFGNMEAFVILCENEMSENSAERLQVESRLQDFW